MGTSKINIIYIVLVLINSAFSANILFVFGGANMSHKTGVWPLVVALAERGHKITFLSSTSKQPQTHTNINDLAPKSLQDLTKRMYGVNRIEDRSKGVEKKLYEEYHEVTFKLCKLILYEPELKEIFETGSYDLVIINSILGECGFLIANHFGSKYIISSSTFVVPWHHGTFHIPMQASWIPNMMESFTFPMGIFDRMLNVWYEYTWSCRESSFIQNMDNLMKERFNVNNAPSFFEMERNASLVLVNSHHSLDFARSLPPMFVDIGGMSSFQPTGELNQEFQDFIDGADYGVVLITFGSTIDLSSMPLNYRNMFYNMMNKFDKIRFIWRWVGDIPDNQPRNLKAAKWLPQREILKHPKTKAFLTHGGVNGVTEATYFGVPLLVMPFFGDQDLSAYRIVATEVGLLLESRELTQEIMDSKFEEILTNPKYKKNMEARSKMFKDRPMGPIETGVYWTEFVLRHDDVSSLKPLQGMSQSKFTNNYLDVYLMSLLIFGILPLILLYILILLGKNLVKKQ